jgi:hypothetical protein
LPCAIVTSIWRSSVTICSALNLFFGMTGSFPSSFSHNAWSKKARSGQLTFEHAGTVQIEYSVQGIGAQHGPMEMEHMQH